MYSLATANSFQVQSGLGVDIEIPSPLPPADELNSIVAEYKIGYAMREAAVYRVWRMLRDNAYQDIYTNDPSLDVQHRLFGSFSDFAEYVCGEIGVSRSKLYSRMKVYSILSWLGISDPQAVAMLADKPNVVERILNALYVFSFDGQEVIGVKNDVFGDDIEDQDHIDTVRDFIVGACSMPSASDALAYINDAIGGSSVKLQFTGDSLLVWCFERSQDGSTTVPFTLEFSYGENTDIPVWVREELNRKYGRA